MQINKTDQKHIIILCSIIFAWIVILFFCVYKPYQNAVSQLAKERSELQTSLNEMQQFEQRYGELNKYEAQLDTGLALMQDKLPPEASGGENIFMQHLAQAAEISGIQLTSVEPLEAEKLNAPPHEGLKMQQMQISFRGSFFETMRFLRCLGAMAQLVVIKAASLKAQENEIDVINGFLTLQIYFSTS